MSVSAPIPATVQIQRGHLLGLIGGVAAAAAAITWALTAYAVGGTVQQSVFVPAASSPIRSNPPALSTHETGPLAAMTAVCSVVMCQPNERLVAARLGIGTQASARAPLTARERSYLESMTAVCSVVMCQPNERLAARLGVSARK